MNDKKKILKILLVLALFIGVASVLYKNLASNTNTNQLNNQQNKDKEKLEKAPDFVVYDRQGNEVQLAAYIGKPIVLNFWASWCPPCKMEMPDFHDMHLELGEDIQFLMINITDGYKETVVTASNYIADNEYTFTVLFDLKSDAATVYGVRSMPTTFFIDAEGYLVAYATGAIDLATLKRGIDMIK
ncbi:MAG: TlpA family protein disulfide reductase [Erysipelotrichia bacterium]|nr:TlpA family protein disulfide reductase [Erysipelotrichia bacterium]